MMEAPISQDSPLPVRVQLRNILLQEVRDKKAEGQRRFPSERELAERFSVSRASVRETISELISSGVLYRTAGRGTFITDEPEPRNNHQIAFLISEDIFGFAETGYVRILRGVEDACRKRGDVLVFQSVGTEVGQLFSKDYPKVDGIVIVGGIRRQHLERLRAAQIPVVLVDLLIRTKSMESETVNIDYSGGTRRAIERLFELKHRRIGFVGFASSDKYESYWQTLASLGLQYDPRIVEFLDPVDLEPGILAGFRAVQKILSRGAPPTAILATNDYVARGAMEALEAAGVSVPNCASVVGYDDFGLGTSPSLSTIRADLEEVGTLAMEALRRRINGNDLNGPTIVPTDFIERSSTAIAPESKDFMIPSLSSGHTL
jgi:DNA-binding LacI/PurR family transcriptional regulator